MPTKTETYGIVKKGSYRVRLVDDTRVIEHEIRGEDLLASLTAKREEELPSSWQIDGSIPSGRVLQVCDQGCRLPRGPGAFLTIRMVVCVQDLDMDPAARKEWMNGERWRDSDNRYVRLYSNGIKGFKRPILCKTVTYTITREK